MSVLKVLKFKVLILLVYAGLQTLNQWNRSICLQRVRRLSSSLTTLDTGYSGITASEESEPSFSVM